MKTIRCRCGVSAISAQPANVTTYLLTYLLKMFSLRRLIAVIPALVVPIQVKLHLDGRLYVPIGNDPEVLDDWPLHRAKQVHSTRLYVGACWQGMLIIIVGGRMSSNPSLL